MAFFVSHVVLTRALDERLTGAGVVGLDVYDVLLTLEMAPNHRLKMSELADKVLLTRSGITRMIDRLEAAGLIERQACPGDRRALHAHLTEKGLAERGRAWPVMSKAIEELFAQYMSESEAEVVATVLKRTIGPDGETGTCCGGRNTAS